MKNTIKVALAGAAITAATLALAPQASATRTWYPTGTAGDQDITLYYNEMTAQGVTGTIPQAWTLEQAACSDLAQGVSEDKLIHIAMNIGVTRSQAKVMVWGAEWHFCPAYY
jgi:hypothetical protein